MLEGFGERILNEIEEKVHSSISVKVIASPDRKLIVWKGGSIFTSLSTNSDLWITKEEYDEHGSYIVHRKCS